MLIRLQREVFGASLKREAPDLKCLQVLLGWSGSATGEHLQRIIFGHYLWKFFLGVSRNVFIYFIFGAKPQSPSEEKAEVVTVIRQTVNSSVIEMFKQPTEAGIRRRRLCRCATCVGVRMMLLCKSEGKIKLGETECKDGRVTLFLHLTSCIDTSPSPFIHLAVSSLPPPSRSDSLSSASRRVEPKQSSQKQNSGVTLNICLSKKIPLSASFSVFLVCSPLINVPTSGGEGRHRRETDCVFVGGSVCVCVCRMRVLS